MKLLPKNKIFIGIDVSADFFHAALLDEAGKIVNTFEEISSDKTEIALWIKELKCKGKEVSVCMEHTGVYSLSIAKILYKAGMKIHLVSPQLLKRLTPTRKAKTDKLDSIALASYLFRNEDVIRQWSPKSKELQELDRLLSNREFFVEQKVALKNKFKSERRYESSTIVLNLIVEQIHFCQKTIDTVEKEITSLLASNIEMKEFCVLAKSVPGVGTTLACELMNATELQNTCISAKQFNAYLGIAPIISQSGKSLRVSAKATGQGNNRIRRLLHLAARSVATHNPDFKEYYKRKVASGKPKMLVLNNIANRLIKIIWAVLFKKQPYIKGYVSVEPRLINQMA